MKNHIQKEHKPIRKQMILKGIVLTIGLFAVLSLGNHFAIKKYKNILYEDTISPSVIQWDGFFLNWYTVNTESEGIRLDEFVEKCFYFSRYINTCRIKIVKWDDQKLFYQHKNRVEHYQEGSTKADSLLSLKTKIDLTGNAYTYKQNGTELYFLTDEEVVTSGNNMEQKKYKYWFYDHGDKYLDLIIQEITPYDDRYEEDTHHNMLEIYKSTYNKRNKKIIGFQKKSKKKLKYIDTSIYNKDGSWKKIPKVDLEGCYSSSNFIIKELCIQGERILLTNYDNRKLLMEEKNIELVDWSELNIYYGVGKPSSSIQYLPDQFFNYDQKQEKFCMTGFECYEKIDWKKLKIIDQDTYIRFKENKMEQEVEQNTIIEETNPNWISCINDRSVRSAYQNKSNGDIIYELFLTEDKLIMGTYDTKENKTIEINIEENYKKSAPIICHGEAIELPPISGVFRKIEYSQLKTINPNDFS